ncbi:hypothetical protein RRG08_000484 [Elysia crispata]|uniref:Uncharacterized protein n=1 Tax=Elysia crispata TaxID=231223 RepID=A0AAE1CWV0_9GAST|nr:hypothetical protein RRG08_000484 [Elysia crispata]
MSGGTVGSHTFYMSPNLALFAKSLDIPGLHQPNKKAVRSDSSDHYRVINFTNHGQVVRSQALNYEGFEARFVSVADRRVVNLGRVTRSDLSCSMSGLATTNDERLCTERRKGQGYYHIIGVLELVKSP